MPKARKQVHHEKGLQLVLYLYIERVCVVRGCNRDGQPVTAAGGNSFCF
jgi:hypothetical protein